MSGLGAAALLALQAVAQGGELPPLSAAPPAGNAPAGQACTGPLYGAFDFWLGNWNVFSRQGGQLVARSQVAKINGDCAVRESWEPVMGKPGGSLHAPDLITGRWHQYWVDSAGTRVDLEGGLYQGNMMLAGQWRGINGTSQNAVLRITYFRLDGDSVRQLAEFSDDDGLTWQVSFDHLYLRADRAD